MKDTLLAIIVGLIVTIIGGVVVAYVIRDPRFRPLEPTMVPTLSATQTQPLIVALSDRFDSANGSYDTNLWTCENECNVDNIFLMNGVLNLQRNNQGWASIKSSSEWAYSDLASLTGKFLINKNLNQGEIGWVSFVGDAVGCGFWGTTEPYVQCSIGPYVDGKHEYVTDNIRIQADTWHSIKYEFDQNSNTIRFYLDNVLIGEYALTELPGALQVYLGIYSPSNTSSGHMYVDDVLLTLNK